MSRYSIYPAFLTQSREEFERELALVKQDGRLKVVQIDIIDGEFVDNLTLFPSDYSAFDFGDIAIDFHLLTQEPLDIVQEIIDMGMQLSVRSVIAQVEHLSYQEALVSEVKEMGWRAGLSLDLHTPLEAIDEPVWSQLDVLQIMGNEAGYQGRPLDPRAVEKVQYAAQKLSALSLDTELVVDVGVKLDTLSALREAGANGFCVGSALWKADEFSKTVSEFLRLLQ